MIINTNLTFYYCYTTKNYLKITKLEIIFFELEYLLFLICLCSSNQSIIYQLPLVKYSLSSTVNLLALMTVESNFPEPLEDSIIYKKNYYVIMQFLFLY